jgi:glutaredoxin
MDGGDVTEKITAVLYTDGNQECERIRMLLKSLGGEYLEYVLGADFSDRQFRMEFGKDAEYPQVTINHEHIGSLKETLQYFQKRNII